MLLKTTSSQDSYISALRNLFFYARQSCVSDTTQGRLYQVRGPSHKGLCGAPQTTIFLFYDVLTFSASLRMCGPQSKAKGGVLFTKYLASIKLAICYIKQCANWRAGFLFYSPNLCLARQTYFTYFFMIIIT